MAAAHDLSFEEADTSLSWVGSSLTLIPTRSIAALKAAFVPDKDLTYDEMSIAKNILLTYMTKCDWPQNLITMFTHFFYFLNGHSVKYEPQGDQAIIAYQAEARLEWHRDLVTSQDNQVFDISIINNDRLENIAKEIRYSIQRKHVLDLTSFIHTASTHQADSSRDNSTVQSTTPSIPTTRKRRRVRQSWMEDGPYEDFFR